MRLYRVDYYSRRDDRKKYYIAFFILSLVFGIAYLIWLSTPTKVPDKKIISQKKEVKIKKENPPTLSLVLATPEISLKKKEALVSPVSKVLEREKKTEIAAKEEKKAVVKEEYKSLLSGIVNLAKVCRGVEKAVPLESDASFLEGEKAFFFTSFNNQEYPFEIVHIWQAPNGKEIARIPLSVKSVNGRTWSYIYVGSEGKWSVIVENNQGKQLAKTSFWVKKP